MLRIQFISLLFSFRSRRVFPIKLTGPARRTRMWSVSVGRQRGKNPPQHNNIAILTKYYVHNLRLFKKYIYFSVYVIKYVKGKHRDVFYISYLWKPISATQDKLLAIMT